MSYSFIVGRQLIPDSTNAQVSTIGNLIVSSVTGYLALDLIDVGGANEAASVPLVIPGLTIQGTKLQLSREFFVALPTIQFPIFGFVRASDNRTQCKLPSNTIAGPCSVRAFFALDVADFNPLCPDNIYRFSPTEQQALSWTEPRLQSANGSMLALTRTHAPGSLFHEGTTIVVYSAQFGQDPAQPVPTRLACSFKVGRLCLNVCFSLNIGT